MTTTSETQCSDLHSWQLNYPVSWSARRLDLTAGYPLRCACGVSTRLFCGMSVVSDLWPQLSSHWPNSGCLAEVASWSAALSLVLFRVVSFPISYSTCHVRILFTYRSIIVLSRSSDYYTKTELPIRLAFFWMSSNLCSIIASFIAYGVLHMRGVLGKAGWRWLFLVE